MARVYYIGDWAVQLGPVYAETSFNYAAKGLDLINYGKWLVEAVQSSGRHEIVSVPTWDFYNMPPGEYEKVLDDHDIIVFSDVEAKNFQLHPQFFNHRLFGTKVLTFPDRVRLTVEAIHAGTQLPSHAGAITAATRTDLLRIVWPHSAGPANNLPSSRASLRKPGPCGNQKNPIRKKKREGIGAVARDRIMVSYIAWLDRPGDRQACREGSADGRRDGRVRGWPGLMSAARPGSVQCVVMLTEHARPPVSGPGRSSLLRNCGRCFPVVMRPR